MAAKKTVQASGSAKATIDHDEIREWVESHGGRPAMVKSTAQSGRGGILRIDFPGFRGERSLKEVSWDDFFDKFEESELAFLYQDQTASSRPSRFNKLVARASLAEGAASAGTQARSAAPRKTTKKAARRASTGRAASAKKPTAKKRPAKKRPAKRAGATQTGRGATNQSARGASARGARQVGRSLKKKAGRQTKKRAPT